MNIKQMPYSEKLSMVRESIKTFEGFSTPFFLDCLGEKGVSNFWRMVESGIVAVDEKASFEEKYETAYANWIWTVKSGYSIVREEMEAQALDAFKVAETEALKRSCRGTALLVLSLVRALSPSAAFRMTMKKLAYQLQWLTPFSVTEFSDRRAVLSIPHCKILDYPDVDDVCSVGCQQVYPMWLAGRFGIDVNFDRQGTACTCTVTRM
jgi:hypothetical protein